MPLPRQTTVLVGHTAAERALLDAYRSGRMPHAWVLNGERGIGKATLAFRLARFLFAHPDPYSAQVAAASDLSVPARHPVVHGVAIGAHPNLLHQERDWDDKNKRHKTGISVEAIRLIHRFLGTTAAGEGWRVVIVDPAEDMTVSAANALLKNLEEPPDKAIFILITRRRGALLPTILSRCRILDLALLSEDEISAVVALVAPDLSEPRGDGLAASLAGGSPRRLIELRQNNGLDLYRMMLGAIGSGDRRAQLKLAASAAAPASWRQFLDLLDGYLARRMRGLPEPAPDWKAPAVPLVTWAELWEKAAVSGREVETYNLDRQQFVLDLLESSSAALR